MKLISKLFSSRYVKNAGWIIFCRIYQAVLNLVVAVLTARYMGPSNYGLINYAASVCAVFTAVASLGTNDILVNELVSRREKTGQILGSAIFYRVCSSILSVMTVCLYVWASDPTDALTVRVTFLYSLTLIFRAFEAVKYWYQANLMSKIPSLISCAAYTVVAGYKFCLLAAKKDVVWFAVSSALDYGVIGLLLLLCYARHREDAQPLSVHPSEEWGLLRRGAPFIVSGLMVSVYGQMDKIMLNSLLNETAVGYYSAATSISTVWTFFLSAIIDSARPLILGDCQKNPQRYQKNLMRLYGTILWLCGAVALGYQLFAGWILNLMYGEAYLPAAGALRILAWSTGFSYLGVARSIWMVSQGKQTYEKYLAAAGVSCNFVLNALLIPAFGVNGAAMATLLTQIITNFIVGFLIPEIRPNNLLICRGAMLWRWMR